MLRRAVVGHKPCDSVKGEGRGGRNRAIGQCVFNLRRDDRLSELEEATKRALTSLPEVAINDHEIDLVPVLRPDDFDGEVTRINVDLWDGLSAPRTPCRNSRRDSRRPSSRTLAKTEA